MIKYININLNSIFLFNMILYLQNLILISYLAYKVRNNII
jgi:hypothetical protein